MMNKAAFVFGKYRYWLTREWLANHDPEGMKVCFVMLNPSTADDKVDDPTIMRCIAFAHRWGFDKLEVRNLYSYRATDPVDLFRAPDPIGPFGDAELADAKEAHLIVAAWGDNAKESRVKEALRLLAPCPLYCLGRTKDGAPRHPLYVKGVTKLERYR